MIAAKPTALQKNPTGCRKRLTTKQASTQLHALSTIDASTEWLRLQVLLRHIQSAILRYKFLRQTVEIRVNRRFRDAQARKPTKTSSRCLTGMTILQSGLSHRTKGYLSIGMFSAP